MATDVVQAQAQGPQTLEGWLGAGHVEPSATQGLSGSRQLEHRGRQVPAGVGRRGGRDRPECWLRPAPYFSYAAGGKLVASHFGGTFWQGFLSLVPGAKTLTPLPATSAGR